MNLHKIQRTRFFRDIESISRLRSFSYRHYQEILIGPARARTLGLSDSRSEPPRRQTLGLLRRSAIKGKCPSEKSFTAYYSLHYNLASTGFSVLTTVSSFSLIFSFALSLFFSFEKELLRPELEREKSQSASFLSFQCMMYRKERTAADNIELLDMASVDMQGLPVWSHHS